MGKFKKGLFLGGILGVAVTWMSLTVKGREFKDKLIDQSGEVYDEVKKRAMASDTWKEIKKSEYVEMVKEVVNKYAVENQLAQDTKKLIIRVVSEQWKNIKNETLTDVVDDMKGIAKKLTKEK